MSVEMVPFSYLFQDISSKVAKIKTTNYLDSGNIPIIDQSANFIAGYSNNLDGFYNENTPIIVFGDHTRAFKFVDFPFFSGADGVKILRPRTTEDPKYLYYALLSLNIESAGYSRHFKFLKEKYIPLPSLERQREIAAVLDKVDELRAKRRQSISKLEELLQSTFLEMFGDPVENPKGWELRKLGEVADVVSGVTKGKKYKDATLVELPYMRVANVQDGRIDLSEIKTVEVSYAEAERYRLMPGDVLLTEGGDPDKLGRGAVWHGEIDECIHQNHIFRVRGQSDLLRPEYLSSLIGSSYGKGYFLRMAKQTTGIASINMTQLKGFPVLLPPIELQDRLTAAYNKRNAVMEGCKLHLQHLDTLYSSLQAQFFSAGT